MTTTPMKSLALLGLLVATSAFADRPAAPAPVQHRYMIERTFPAGALAGLDATTKAKVNANNAKVGVRWIESFANADKTKTYCIYEGPSEAAVRKAAALNELPVEIVMEVPHTLTPR